MGKRDAISIGQNGVLCLLVLVCFGVFGCATTGKIISEDKRIPLVKEGRNSGVLQDGWLSVEYSYRLAGEEMALTGHARYRHGFDWLDVYILFLDSAGKQIDKKKVYSSGYRNWSKTRERGFESTLMVPPEATGFSFSYYTEERKTRR